MTNDADDFLNRLGRGVDRLAAGDLSMFADTPPKSQTGQQRLAALLQELAVMHEIVRIVEAGIVEAAKRANMTEAMIGANQQKGHRSGRDLVASMATRLLIDSASANEEGS